MHPFLDGNGRVARLMSHAMLLETLDTGGVWSIARGLARNVQQYKALLANCDRTRRNDLDGRGTLSEEALVAFTRFFLTVCIDQVTFMESLIQPDRLHTRILLWAKEEMALGEIPAKSDTILQAILYRGELPRGEADAVAGTGERQARRIVSALLKRGILISENPAPHCGSRFPRRWPPVGCRGCFRRSPAKLECGQRKLGSF
jgi:Fic family protein